MNPRGGFKPNNLMNQFRSLELEIDEIFEGFSHSRGLWQRPLWHESKIMPLINVHETSESFVVTSEIPGVKVEDLTVKIEGDKLVLHGERKTETHKNVSYLRRERASGIFQRTFSFPRKIDQDNVTALYKNGVLTVTLLKESKGGPRRIHIN
ncbi:MAG: Hsp20/alpha crystallin family protein [Desulfomonilaceae bacterium]